MDEFDPFSDEGSIDTDYDDSLNPSLFEGDEGELELEQRQTLVFLLKRSVITQAANRREWDTLVRDPRTTRFIRSRLHEMFLDLVLDRDKGVAYKVQVRSDTPRQFPTLIRDTNYNREETVLLVLLRKRHLAEAVGLAQVRVDLSEMLAEVASYRPASATDVHGDETRVKNAVKSLVGEGILQATDDEQRFIISPVIESVLPLDRLKQMLTWLREANAAGPDLQELGDDEDTDLETDLDPDESTGLDTDMDTDEDGQLR
jgi:hypothetical protein